MIWYDIVWHDIVWYSMIWYDMIWYSMIWYDMTWHELIFDLIWFFWLYRTAIQPFSSLLRRAGWKSSRYCFRRVLGSTFRTKYVIVYLLVEHTTLPISYLHLILMRFSSLLGGIFDHLILMRFSSLLGGNLGQGMSAVMGCVMRGEICRIK